MLQCFKTVNLQLIKEVFKVHLYDSLVPTTAFIHEAIDMNPELILSLIQCNDLFEEFGSEFFLHFYR